METRSARSPSSTSPNRPSRGERDLGPKTSGDIVNGPLSFVDPEIEEPGLAYAINEGNGHGRLTFVPMARVLAVVAKGHRL